MYTIYTFPNTGGFAAEAMLEAGAQPWQREIVDTKQGQHHAPGYLDVNPAGQVPALRLPDGSVITESAAICIYLGDIHPETGLAPPVDSPERPAYLRWLLYMSSALYPADLRLYYPQRYCSGPAGVETAIAETARRQLHEGLALIDRSLADGQWLAGGRPSAADLYLLMIVHWYPDPDGLLAELPKLAALCDRTRRLNCAVKANSFHRLW
jgi:glutathione S-transferase